MKSVWLGVVVSLLACVLSAQEAKSGVAEERKLSPTETAWKLLNEGVRSEDGSERIEALQALASVSGEPRVVPMIVKGLEDPDKNVRLMAAMLLGQLKAKQAVKELQDAIEDESAEVGFAAAQALWNMGDRSGRAVMFQVLGGERKTSPNWIKAQMGEQMKVLKSPEKLALMGAQEATGFFFGPASMGIGFLAEMMKDSGAQGRVLAATLLAEDASSTATQELVEALRDKNWAVRVAAVRALGTRKDRALLKEVEPMMNDDKSAVRVMAAATVLRIMRASGGRVSASSAAAGGVGGGR